MGADFNQFNEAFDQLKGMFGENPPGEKKTPFWVKYIEVRAGDTLEKIIPTAFQMHAAVTGKKLYFENLNLLNKDKNNVDEVLEDIQSKIPCIFTEQYYDFTNLTLLNDDTFCIYIGNISINIYSFNKDTIKYIKDVVKFHSDK